MAETSAIPRVPPAAAVGRSATQYHRLLWQSAFFVLFVTAPAFDILRFDLTAGHAVIFGHDWRLGIDDFASGRIGSGQLAVNLLLRLFLPVVGGAMLFIAVAWRWGRLYCGWLCPHFSVVETINRVMKKASGRPSVWERKPVPRRNPDGTAFVIDPRWWFATVPLALLFAFVWSVVLLTYLLPPFEVYGNLLALAPTRNQRLFIGGGTVLLSIEFLLARHLFCRYACAVGLFQSLAWMGNRGAMVVGFDRPRAADCAACHKAGGPGYYACESACPMRLKPRATKNAMFACTQCGQCLDACATVQSPRTTLLSWTEGETARRNEAPVSLTGQREP